MENGGELLHSFRSSGFAQTPAESAVYAVHTKRSVYTRFAKPLLDRSVAAILLIALAPLMAVLYFCIRIESRGSGIFRQERIGLSGQVFSIYKFRTMYTFVPKEGRSPEGENDPRVTGVGRVLRKTSLDELPQLVNILKGEMSFIGPRPEQKSIVELHYTPLDYYRFMVKPGITGLWQTSEDRKKPIYENLHHDFDYIDGISFWLDFKIVLRTVKVLFRSNTY